VAIHLADKDLIRRVGESALTALSVELASEAFSLCGDGAQYNVLNPLRGEEEYAYLRG
jgi:hypothetical protein